MSSQYRSRPSLSVVIPTYNRAPFLPAAVASIRAQSQPCDEIVIVDDGSSDDTEQVVAALGSAIRYVKQANAGPAAARNRGVREARGELVAFLDTDDRWLPDKLALQLEILHRSPEVALVSADMAIEDRAGTAQVASNFARRGLKPFFDELAGRPIPDAPRRLLALNFVNTSCVLMRRAVFLQLDGFDPRLRYGEDLELWLRVAARHALACVPSVQQIRVEHDANVTKSIEPMLIGYVRMAEVIREWAAESMPAWGWNPDRYVANCLSELGYWYFSQHRLPEARAAFIRSLRESPNRRALLYGAASAMPLAAVEGLRRLKAGRERSAARPASPVDAKASR